jgi:hypothetical protein
MEFDANYRFMQYLYCSIFLLLFFEIITIFVSLISLHLKYFKALKKKESRAVQPFRYFGFLKSKFTKRNVLTVAVLIPLCLTGVALTLIAIKTNYRADILRFELRNTSTFRIRTGGLCHREPECEEELYKTNDKNAIKGFLDTISFEPLIVGPVCCCCGNVTFEFYKNDELISTWSLHHGKRVRFPYSLGDCELTPRSKQLLGAWLREKGVFQEGKVNSTKDDL